MSRKPVKVVVDHRVFNRTARATKAINLGAHVSRGGIRL